MLEVCGVKSHYGRIEVLHGISLRVARGEAVALIGANGAGKTTLLKTISGLQPVTSGSILIDHEALGSLPAHRRAELGIAHVPEGRQIFGGMKVEDNLKIGAWTHRHRKDFLVDLERIYKELPVLREIRLRLAGSLSGGQQQMLAIGRALMLRPRLMLLDEPSMGLAPVAVDQVYETLKNLKRKGMTILLVEQNASLALGFADRAYVIETGNVLVDGESSRLQTDLRVHEAYFGT